MRLPRAQRLMLRLQLAPLINSLRLAPASPALEGGKPPLNRTFALNIYLKRNVITGFFRDILDLKWTLNHSNRIQNGHEYPVPCSILQRASFWSKNVLINFDFFRDILTISV